MSRLTNAQMQAIINAGGSVTYQGRVIKTIAGLPTDDEINALPETPASPVTTEGNLSLSDVTAHDVSTARHGFAPKAPGDASKFLNGEGQYVILELSKSRGGAGSYQLVAADLTLEADAGTSEAGDTDFLAPIMGNALGENLTEENNYIAGVIAVLSVLGVRATILPITPLLAVLNDGVTEADAIVLAHIDGSDPSSETHARAAFGVSQANNNAASSVEYGLDLKFEPSAELNTLMSGTAKPFKVTKGLSRSPHDVVWLEGDGVPVDGTTGDNFAGKGSRYTDYTNGEEYINTGTITASVWKKITHA